MKIKRGSSKSKTLPMFRQGSLEHDIMPDGFPFGVNRVEKKSVSTKMNRDL